MQLKFKRTEVDAIIPRYASDGAACFDLCAINEGFVVGRSSETFEIGLAFEVPDGHVMLIYSRSGHGFKNGVRLSNCTGVIDSDYRGAVRVRLQNDSDITYRVEKGDRIAQAMVIPIPVVTLCEAEELSETARGANGFGSTGQ